MRSHRLWYLVLLLVVFLFNLFFSRHLSYCAFWLALILPLPFLLLLWVTRGHIAVKLEAAGPSAERGSEIPFTITITNNGRLPLSCGKLLLAFDNTKTGEHFEKVLPFSAASRSTTRVQWSVVARHCGCVTVRVRRAKALDLLGLFSLPLPARPELRLLSLPHVPAFPQNAPKPLGENAECFTFYKDKPGCDPCETFGVREYQPGDSPRSVHWKLSGKLDRLMVRQFSQPASHSTLLLLEQGGLTAPPSPVLLDTLLDTHAALSAYFLAKLSTRTSLWYDSRADSLQSLEVATGQDAAQETTGILCAPPYSGGGYALQAFSRLAAKPYARILYMTTLISWEELLALCNRYRLSQVVVLYCCLEEAPAQKKEAEMAGISLIPLHPGRLFEELLALEL